MSDVAFYTKIIAKQSNAFVPARDIFLADIETRDPNPMIPGTDIPLYRVTALLDGGYSVSMIREDFPTLSRNQILQARAYAGLYPNLGQPYPSVSLKRLLLDSGVGELFDELAKIRRSRKKK